MSRRRVPPKKQSASNTLGLDVFPEYLGEARESLSTRYKFESQLGEGKTGVAFLLTTLNNPFRKLCLKTIKESITDPTLIADVRRTLQKEVDILRPLSHRCLPTIIEAGLDAPTPYYVCSFQAGMTFYAAKHENRKLTLRESIFAISSLIDVCKHLHSVGRTHCDLHSNNVLLGTDILADGLMVIDFGSGHKESDSTPETLNRGNVNFKPIASQITDRSVVNRHDFAEEFRKADIAALGKLFAQMLDVFLTGASIATRDEYVRLCADMQNGRLTDWSSIEDRFDLVVDPYRCVGRNADLFLGDSGVPESIVVPATGAVVVGVPAIAIINEPAFQRMRGLKQLSFCDWHFPGAHHTRFEHSLGVFSNASRCIKRLSHHAEFRGTFTPQEVRGFLLASLLHDIGHYPFAHVLEQYVTGRFPDDKILKDAASHEVRTLSLLDSDSSLRDAIKLHWGADTLLHAKKVLLGQTPGLSQLLNGPLDIDKIDYLRRDARHCGVPFGEGLDSRKVLESLRYVSSTKAIGISIDGVASVEGFLVLQDQMLGEVYWHQAVRAVIAMFHAVIAFCVRTREERLKQLLLEIQGCSSEADAITNVIQPAIAAIPNEEFGNKVDAEKTRAALKKMTQLFLCPDYSEIYHPIAVYRRNDETDGRSTVNVYNSIVQPTNSGQSPLGIDWKNVRKLRACLQSALAEKKIVASELDVIIDAPIGKHGHPSFVVVDEKNRVSSSFDAMPHVNRSIHEQPATQWSPVRVYVSPLIMDEIGGRSEVIVQSAGQKFFHGSDE